MSPLRYAPYLATFGLLFLVAACTQPAPTSPGVLTTHTPAASPSTPALYTPTESPPRVDISIAGVAPEDVVFDTFRGGYVPLSEATDDLIESLSDAIKPVYEPRYDSVEGGKWLDDDDLVIGYAAENKAYAYPHKILNLHEIVNDFIDGVPVLVSYCPLCASGVVYNRELDGRALLFGNTSALYQSDMVMYDHQTGSYWFQVAGEAIVGPLTGKRITMLPSMTTTWGEWKLLHPNTSILSKDLGLLGSSARNPYDRDPFVGYADRVAQEHFAFPVSEEKLDRRLNAGEMVRDGLRRPGGRESQGLSAVGRGDASDKRRG